MKNIKNLIFLIIVFETILFHSCTLIQINRVKIFTLDRICGEKIVLFPNGQYKINDNISTGDYYQFKNIYILNSKYKRNEIKNIQFENSQNNNDSLIALFVKSLHGKHYYHDVKVILFKKDFCDTFLLGFNHKKDFILFDKRECFDSLAIELFEVNYFQPLCLLIAAKSKKYYFNSEFDTVTCYLDALGTDYNYNEFNYSPLIRKRKFLYSFPEYFNQKKIDQ